MSEKSWDEYATEEERAILHGPCSSEQKCWWNPESGYLEYCPVHEAVVADIYYRTKEPR